MPIAASASASAVLRGEHEDAEQEDDVVVVVEELESELCSLAAMPARRDQSITACGLLEIGAGPGRGRQ